MGIFLMLNCFASVAGELVSTTVAYTEDEQSTTCA